MKYFKPELLARYRSLNDDVADIAAAEWERVTDAYNAWVDVLRPALPAAARVVLDRVTLHDATVLGITLTKGKPRLSLLIRLEGTQGKPGKVLELMYLLANGPKHRALISPRDAKKDSPVLGRILYDEFGRGISGVAPVFSHSLLLSTGYELRIRFTGMRIRQLRRVILPSAQQAGLGAG